MFIDDSAEFQYKKDLIENASSEQLLRLFRRHRDKPDSPTFQLVAEQLQALGIQPSVTPTGAVRRDANPI